MTGTEPRLLVDTPPSPKQAAILIGKAALAADPSLGPILGRTAKKVTCSPEFMPLVS